MLHHFLHTNCSPCTFHSPRIYFDTNTTCKKNGKQNIIHIPSNHFLHGFSCFLAKLIKTCVCLLSSILQLQSLGYNCSCTTSLKLAPDSVLLCRYRLYTVPNLKTRSHNVIMINKGYSLRRMKATTCSHIKLTS